MTTAKMTGIALAVGGAITVETLRDDTIDGDDDNHVHNDSLG